MLKNRKLFVLSIACMMVASASQFVLAQELASDGEYHVPSPEEIAAQQPDEWNEETGQFEAAGPLALGDAMADLVYTPVTPCRVANTLLGTGAFDGPINGGTTVGIDMDTGNMTSQGGSATGCGVFTNAAAVAITVTAVNASGSGHFQVFPYLNPLPNASVLNYRAIYPVIANTTIVPQNTSPAAQEISLYVSTRTHFIVDVVGYFNRPGTTTPSQYVTSSGLTAIGPGVNSVYSPVCPTGYRVMGGGCELDQWTADVPNTSCRPSNGGVSLISGANVADRWMGQWDNNTGGSVNVNVQAMCIRIP